MDTPHYSRYIGVRFTPQDQEHLRVLVRFTGATQSAVIRYLVRTAAQRPEAVAAGIRREAAHREA